jgi:hypothetical protein
MRSLGRPPLLVDGYVSGWWRIERKGERVATLLVEPLDRLPAAERKAVIAEGRKLLAFLAPGAAQRAVRVARPVS